MVSDQRTYMQYNVIDVGKTWKRKYTIFKREFHKRLYMPQIHSQTMESLPVVSLKHYNDNKIQYQIKS